jgi:hypothetical protein
VLIGEVEIIFICRQKNATSSLCGRQCHKIVCEFGTYRALDDALVDVL